MSAIGRVGRLTPWCGGERGLWGSVGGLVCRQVGSVNG